MKRFNIEGFNKYTFGLDGSIYHIRLKRFVKGSKGSKDGYLRFSLQNDDNIKKSIRQQQIVYKLFNPDYELFQGHKLVVDHINSNKLDNHISNLRLITNRENLSKEQTEKSGLPVGVCYIKNRNRYQTQIMIDGKKDNLGYFLTPQEASIVYQNKLKSILI